MEDGDNRLPRGLVEHGASRVDDCTLLALVLDTIDAGMREELRLRRQGLVNEDALFAMDHLLARDAEGRV